MLFCASETFFQVTSWKRTGGLWSPAQRCLCEHSGVIEVKAQQRFVTLEKGTTCTLPHWTHLLITTLSQDLWHRKKSFQNVLKTVKINIQETHWRRLAESMEKHWQCSLETRQTTNLGKYFWAGLITLREKTEDWRVVVRKTTQNHRIHRADQVLA